MDITVNISTPIITGAAKFMYRYRLLPSGSFNAYADEFDNAIELTGLSAGQYQIEVVYVNEDGVECPAVLKEFTVYEEFDCLNFAATLGYQNSVPVIIITYTVPSPYNAFPCGYLIQYTSVQLQQTQSVLYPILPASPIYIPVIPSQDYQLDIFGQLCNGQLTECYSERLPVAYPPCVPLSGITVGISVAGLQTNGDYGVIITANFTQSSPATSVMLINWSQTGVLTPNPPANGVQSIALTPSSTTASFATNLRYQFPLGTPILAPPNTLSIAGTIIDDCGISHNFTASFEL